MIRFFLCVSILFYTHPIYSSVCTFKNEPEIVEENNELLAMVFEEEDDEVFLSPFKEEDEAYDDYINWVQENFMTDPYDLLERQKDIFVKFGFSPYNFDLILNREAGSIRDMNCLEALLFLEHNSFSPLQMIPSEFLAYVLKKESLLRIYFTSVKKLEANGKFFEEDVVHNIEEGWEYITHIHSHPFVIDNPAGDIAGTTIPSGGDLLIFRKHRNELELQKAWITNGISSIVVRSDEFDLFETQ